MPVSDLAEIVLGGDVGCDSVAGPSCDGGQQGFARQLDERDVENRSHCRAHAFAAPGIACGADENDAGRAGCVGGTDDGAEVAGVADFFERDPRRCRGDLLRGGQFGVALLNYESTRNRFPPGAEVRPPFGPGDVFGNANALLLPYFEESTMAINYKYDRPYWEQAKDIIQAPVEIFTCPTNGHQFHLNDVFEQLGIPAGNTFATSDYSYCHGSTDSWCIGKYPRWEIGVFHLGVGTKVSKIVDGMSQTIAMGEAAGGKQWTVCHGIGCTEPAPGLDASYPWIVGTVPPDFVLPVVGTSNFGATIARINKLPVTNTMIAVRSIGDCRSSLSGGPHHTSNFRSDHAGGAQFVFCDGSVTLLADSIDMKVYRAKSTIAGHESVRAD